MGGCLFAGGGDEEGVRGDHAEHGAGVGGAGAGGGAAGGGARGGLAAARGDGVAALVRLKAIMEARVRHAPPPPLPLLRFFFSLAPFVG